MRVASAPSSRSGKAGPRLSRRSATLADVLSIDLPAVLRVSSECHAEQCDHQHFYGGDDRELFSVMVMKHDEASLAGGTSAFERVFIGRAGLAALLIHCLRRFETEFCAASPAHPYTGREPEVVVDDDADGEAATVANGGVADELPAAPRPKIATRRSVRRAS
ncbi:MAG: hypothetical protein SF069_17685 [Phycisphaerae bacterium]|nr:hypothetical protein [Phycisphaerae bacterium]